jgi:hypothetical protein
MGIELASWAYVWTVHSQYKGPVIPSGVWRGLQHSAVVVITMGVFVLYLCTYTRIIQACSSPGYHPHSKVETPWLKEAGESAHWRFICPPHAGTGGKSSEVDLQQSSHNLDLAARSWASEHVMCDQ